MEDFDYIDELVKSELSDRELRPSEDGWDAIREKMKRKKRKRRLFFILPLLFGLGVGLFLYIQNTTNTTEAITSQQQINTNNSDSKSNQTNTDKELDSESTKYQVSKSNEDSNSENVSNKNDNYKNADKKGIGKGVVTSQKNESSVKANQSSVFIGQSKMSKNNFQSTENDGPKNQTDVTSGIIDEEKSILEMQSKGVRLSMHDMETPDFLKRKRKRRSRKKRKKQKTFKENIEVTLGVNGFTSPGDYKLGKSYFGEVSFLVDKKLNKRYNFNYGMSLMYRNLQLKNDTLRINRGEFSLNVLANVERKFGDYSVEAGAYFGYKLIAPHNRFYEVETVDFFSRKFQYGLVTILNYRKIGLVFKYELSPYFDLGEKRKNGRFMLGLKYDF